MLPSLKYIRTENSVTLREIVDHLTKELGITEEERNQIVPSGGKTILYARVSWAIFDLRQAGFIRNKSRGELSITKDGRKVLEQNPTTIDKKFLLKFPKYQEYDNEMKQRQKKRLQEKRQDEGDEKEISEQSPEDMMISGHVSIRESVEKELREKINSNTPSFFESLVLELVRKMGYGVDSHV